MPAYKIEIEIYEGKGGQLKKDEHGISYPNIVKEGICAWMYRGDGKTSYQVGHIFNWPEDAGKICPWLLGSMHSVIDVLRFGGKLPWQYPDTPYKKQMDSNGATTEFIRCIDPTASGIVVKILRTKIG